MKALPLFFAAVIAAQAFAGVPAFPGAEGWGRNATGGRDPGNTRILSVTSLEDSGPGTLREALMHEGPRIIIFKTGGIIDLKSSISFRNGDVTIAGQTAPGDGIIIRNYPIRIGARNVIMRGIRIRNGDGPGPVGDLRDSIQIGRVDGPRVENVIVDHCSFGWSMDETAEFWYGCRNVTLSYCIFSEALWLSQHQKGKHGYAMLFGERPNEQVSVHHNLFAHNERRNPWVKDNAAIEIANNVVYNWGTEATGLWLGVQAEPINVNVVGNCYKAGADTHPRHVKDGSFIDLHLPAAPGSRIHLAGNVGLGRTGAEDPWSAVWLGGKTSPTKFRSDAPLSVAASGMTVEPAEVAYQHVLAIAGARPLDSADRRAMDDTRNGTGKHVDKLEEVGGYPEYARGVYPSDVDDDGIPDRWEQTHGLNPNDPADATRLSRDGSGYLNIEQYINSLLPLAADREHVGK